MRLKTCVAVAVALGFAIAALPQDAHAIGGTIGGKKGDPCKLKGLEERAKRLHGCPPYDKKGAVASPSSGGPASGATAGPQSGSSEHGSIRGTINAGGDFIAPKLQEKTPKPRGVAPRPQR